MEIIETRGGENGRNHGGTSRGKTTTKRERKNGERITTIR